MPTDARAAQRDEPTDTAREEAREEPVVEDGRGGDEAALGSGDQAGCSRYALLPLFLAALVCTLVAIGAVVTHTYDHPVDLVSRWVGVASVDSSDAAAQTCEMSYFYLSHKVVPLTRLSDISQAMVEGRLELGSELHPIIAPPAVARRPAPRRLSAEFDEEEELALAAAEAAEAAEEAARPAAKHVNLNSTANIDEFASYTRLFLSALPRELSTSRFSSGRYRLIQYVAHARPGKTELYARGGSSRGGRAPPAHNLLARVPVLFLHGNGGHYHQMRSLASRLAERYVTEQLSGSNPAHLPDLNDYYSVDMLEESGALSGALLWRQAWFVNEALGEILRAYPPETRAIIVGHSMGGVVARALWALGNFPRAADGGGRVAMVATLGTPHRAPVLHTDNLMDALYRAINQPPPTNTTSASHSTRAHLVPLLASNYTIHADRPFFVSASGGERDFQIEPALTQLQGLLASEHTLSIATHALQYAPLNESGGAGAASTSRPLASVDHQALCWCRQLVEVLAGSVREATRDLLADRLNTTRRDENDRMASQKALWRPDAMDAMRAIAATTTPPRTSADENTAANIEWEIFADQPQSGGHFTSRLDLSHVGDGLVSVWMGSMSSVLLCPVGEEAAASPSSCADLSQHVRLLAPRVHPEHAAFSREARVNKDFGIASTYLLHLSEAQLRSLRLPAGSVDLRLQPTDATINMLQTVSLGFSRRVRVAYGMSYRLADLSEDTASLANIGAVYRWTRPLAAGIDTKLQLRVGANKLQEGTMAHNLPNMIAFFASTSDDADGALLFPASYSDQLFAFYPTTDGQTSHQRIVHAYRSGMDRQLTGLLIRIPSSVSSDGSDLSVSLTLDSWSTFVRTLYLQAPMLPRILFGVSLALFGVQHDTLRRYGAFPRAHQLLVLQKWRTSAIFWGLLVGIVACHLFFHGGLIGDAATFSQEELKADDIGLWAGFTFEETPSLLLAGIGFTLCLACVVIYVVLETIIYFFLWIGSFITSMVGRGVAWPFRALASSPPAGDEAASASTAAAPTRSNFWSLLRYLVAAAWFSFFFSSCVFTSAVTLAALDFFGGLRVLDLFALGGRLVDSFNLVVAPLVGVEHANFERDILPWLRRSMMVDDVNIIVLIGGVALLSVATQMVVFPRASSKQSESRRRADASAAAHKASSIMMMILVAGVLLAPQVIASFRLDADTIDRAWEANTRDRQSSLLFQPPAADKTFHADAQVPAPNDSPASGTFLFPFVVTSPLDPLSMIALCWVTLSGWCVLHTPFSPPVLQAACLASYGIALFFARGPAAALRNFWRVALMLCLCVLPHALSSGLFVLHLIGDFVEGTDTDYERAYTKEIERQVRQRTMAAHAQFDQEAAARKSAATTMRQRPNKKRQ